VYYAVILQFLTTLQRLFVNSQQHCKQQEVGSRCQILHVFGP